MFNGWDLKSLTASPRVIHAGLDRRMQLVRLKILVEKRLLE